jgi:hypothetical protein
VLLTVVPAGALAGRATVVLTLASSGVRDLLSVLLAVVVSGTLVVLTPAVTVAPLVVTPTVCTVLVLAPGARVTGAKVVVTPLITTVGVKVTVALPLLVNVMVELTVVPAGALAGRATVVLTSASSGVSVRVCVLSAKVVSGTVEPLAPPVTVAPLKLTPTGCTVLVLAPGARVTGTKVVVTPLITTVGVKVVVAEPVLVKLMVLLTVVPAGALAGRATVVLTLASKTVRTELTVVVLLPTEVAKDPGGSSLVPVAVPLTTTDTEQEPLGGITVPNAKVSVC